MHALKTVSDEKLFGYDIFWNILFRNKSSGTIQSIVLPGHNGSSLIKWTSTRNRIRAECKQPQNRENLLSNGRWSLLVESIILTVPCIRCGWKKAQQYLHGPLQTRLSWTKASEKPPIYLATGKAGRSLSSHRRPYSSASERHHRFPSCIVRSIPYLVPGQKPESD